MWYSHLIIPEIIIVFVSSLILASLSPLFRIGGRVKQINNSAAIFHPLSTTLKSLADKKLMNWRYFINSLWYHLVRYRILRYFLLIFSKRWSLSKKLVEIFRKLFYLLFIHIVIKQNILKNLNWKKLCCIVHRWWRRKNFIFPKLHLQNKNFTFLAAFLKR
jgi:hypothetical protein